MFASILTSITTATRDACHFCEDKSKSDLYTGPNPDVLFQFLESLFGKSLPSLQFHQELCFPVRMEGKLKDGFGIGSTWYKCDADAANTQLEALALHTGADREDVTSAPSHMAVPVPIYALHHDAKDVALCKSLLMSCSSSHDAKFTSLALRVAGSSEDSSSGNAGGHCTVAVLPVCTGAWACMCHRCSRAIPALWLRHTEQLHSEKQCSSASDSEFWLLGFVYLCVCACAPLSPSHHSQSALQHKLHATAPHIN